jgi:hypothetical protein
VVYQGSVETVVELVTTTVVVTDDVGLVDEVMPEVGGGYLVTTDVVERTGTADVDSVGAVKFSGGGDESVKVESSFWRITAAPVVEPLRIRPSATRRMITNKVTRRLVATSSRLLFIHLLFSRCMHLTMSCSWRIN